MQFELSLRSSFFYEMDYSLRIKSGQVNEGLETHCAQFEERSHTFPESVT